MSSRSCLLYFPLGNSFPTFNLENAVCSHGFFMMAPNFWDPKNKTLTRPFRLFSNSTISILVTISQLPPLNSFLRIKVMFDDNTCMSSQDKQYLLDQIVRMLRITRKDEMEILEFQKIYPYAKKRGFGRVFRSPTLFEDMVKSILLCNCGWSRTLDMAKALCDLQFELKHHPNKLKRSRLMKKRKHHDVDMAAPDHRHYSDDKSACGADSTRSTGVEVMGDFPIPAELAKFDEIFLEKRCNLGYRARAILELAKTIEAIYPLSFSSSSSSSSNLSNNTIVNKLELLKQMLLVSNNDDEVHEREQNKQVAKADEVNKQYCNVDYYDKLYKELKGFKGFGPFVCSYVLTCIGCYDRIPADTETVRHLKEVHQKENCTSKTVNKDAEEIYGMYAPFQYLVYWSEIWKFYENRFGKMSKLPPENYKTVTGTFKPATSAVICTKIMN